MQNLNLQLHLQSKPQLRHGCTPSNSPPPQFRALASAKGEAGVAQQRRSIPGSDALTLHVAGNRASPPRRSLTFDNDRRGQPNGRGALPPPGNARCPPAFSPAVDVTAPLVTPVGGAAGPPKECEGRVGNMSAALCMPAALSPPSTREQRPNSNRQGLRPLGSAGSVVVAASALSPPQTRESRSCRGFLRGMLEEELPGGPSPRHASSVIPEATQTHLSDRGSFASGASSRTLFATSPPTAGLFWAQLPAAARTCDLRCSDCPPAEIPAAGTRGALSIHGLHADSDSEKLPRKKSFDACFTSQLPGQSSGALRSDRLPVEPSFQMGAPFDKICISRLPDGLSHRTAKTILKGTFAFPASGL